jgi:uncharacterized protein (TIGR02996 family)
MTGRDSFLRAICASPDDDLLRLVYAGWLEENGDLDRAAFIRARCAMARVPEYDPVRVQYWDLEGRWRPGMTAAEEEPPPLPHGLGWAVSAYREPDAAPDLGRPSGFSGFIVHSGCLGR